MPRLREFAAVASLAMGVMTVALAAQNLHISALPGMASLPTMAADAQTRVPRILHVGDVARYVVRVTLSVPEPRIAQDAPLVEPDGVAQRVRDIVPSELFGYFDLYLYVSKAASGPWAQHMVVFRETDSGRLQFEDRFAVSTGRERQEKYFTSTPAGLFELDPDRFDRVHYSHRWNNAPMPWAMFLDYTINGHETGVALHSADGHAADLGHRASGGCVRLPPEKAQELFERIQRTEIGRVPVFAMDGSTTDKLGHIVRNEDGSPLFTQGYKVLLIIEDYPGAPVVVAMLS
jgi:hypothetical protein